MPCVTGKFKPLPNEVLNLAGAQYKVQPHPAASHLPFSAEGRRAIVYNLHANGGSWALKVFKRKYRNADVLHSSIELQKLAGFPGMLAAKRTVIRPEDQAALECLDLGYATLMPWVTGSTWNDLLLSAAGAGAKGRPIFDFATALKLASRLLEIMLELERIGAAHTDIAPGNVILSPASGEVQLLDLEDLYLPGASKPVTENTGTPGYRHPSADKGQTTWRSEGDRYAVAIMTAEFLLMSEPALGALASDTGYFEGNRDSQTGADRYAFARPFLQAVAPAFAQQFETAWNSANLESCPSIAELASALSAAPRVAPASASASQVPGVSWVPIGAPHYMRAAAAAAGSSDSSFASSATATSSAFSAGSQGSSVWVRQPIQAPPPAPTPSPGPGGSSPASSGNTAASGLRVPLAVWVIAALVIIAMVWGLWAQHNAQVQRERVQAEERERIQAVERAGAERRAAEERQRQQAQEEQQRRKAQEFLETVLHPGLAALVAGDSGRYHNWLRQRVPQMGSQVITVKFFNQCPRAVIDLALRYQVPDNSGAWAVVGWWNIKPGESLSPNMATVNQNLYYYAASEDGKLLWDGSQETNALSEIVLSRPFVHRDGVTTLGEGSRTVQMGHWHSHGFGEQEIPLTCPN